MSGCGECTECCTYLAVPSLNKPTCRTCEHVEPKKGCGIYEARPGECRAFECVWLQMSRTPAPLPKKMRPDKSGVMFVMTTRDDTIAAHMRIPGALRTGNGVARLVKQWMKCGIQIVEVCGQQRKLIMMRKE